MGNTIKAGIDKATSSNRLAPITDVLEIEFFLLLHFLANLYLFVFILFLKDQAARYANILNTSVEKIRTFELQYRVRHHLI